MPDNSEREVRMKQLDFSGGIHSRFSPADASARALRFVKDAVNVLFRPHRAFSVKPGSRDTSTGSLPQKPTSLGKNYSTGGNKTFVATDDGSGSGNIYRHTATSDTVQTLPGTFTPTAAKWRFEMANGILVGTQIANTGGPLFYAPSNPADTWHELKLPAPPSAPTFNADSAGGSLTDTKIYFWRYRWRYLNGSSKTSPVSASNTMNTPNLTANLILAPPASPRSDYLGWTLERTDQNGSALGPFYFVADGTAGTASDGAADADLNYRTSEVIHGEPVAMDGTIFHKDRLFGWRNSSLYFSQQIIDEEGTGIANWVGDAIEYVDKDDGDTIQRVEKQGDRLLIGKANSLHVLEGFDIDSFRLRRIYDGAGFAGPRASCSLGPTVFFYGGNGRLFVVRGDSVKPVWSEELGDQLRQIDTVYDADVLAVNWKGEMVLFGHRRKDSTSQRDWLGYDLQFGNCIRFQDPPAIDALVQKDEVDFGEASILLADPVIRQPVVTTSPSTNPSFYSWRDARGASTQVYVQSVDSNGAALWTANGVQAGNSTGASQVLQSAICGDGAGGCIVAFCDNRGGTKREIYVQKYNAAGAAQWTASGVAITNNAGAGASPPGNGSTRICTDGAGGAIIAWADSRSTGLLSTVYAQRVNASGAVQWTANGVSIGAGAGLLTGAITLLPRSGGGAWLAWQNFGTTTGLQYQALDGAGAAILTAGGVGVAMNGSTAAFAMCRDNSTGIFLAYQAAGGSDISVKRIGATGTVAWTTDMTAGRAAMYYPALVSDGGGGCFLAWRDGTPNVGVRAQRASATGVLQWAAGGVPLNTPVSGSNIESLYALMDGSGGAIFSWDSATTSASWVQKVDANGLILWGTEGVQLLPAGPTALYPRITTDGNGGCIAEMFYSNTDIKVQRVKSDATKPWGVGGVTVAGAANAQDLYWSAFTDTPETEYPPGATAGYHVWAGFEGTTEFAAEDGSGGAGIFASVASHRYDAAMPQNTKDTDWLEVYVNKGRGQFAVTVEGDPGVLATVSLTASAQAVKYNSGVKYNDGSRYATTGETTVTTGLPMNTEGRGLKVTFAGTFTDELEIGGWALDAMALPKKEYSR